MENARVQAWKDGFPIAITVFGPERTADDGFCGGNRFCDGSSKVVLFQVCCQVETSANYFVDGLRDKELDVWFGIIDILYCSFLRRLSLGGFISDE